MLETCGLAVADGRPEDIWAAYSETGGFAATSEPVTESVIALGVFFEEIQQFEQLSLGYLILVVLVCFFN